MEPPEQLPPSPSPYSDSDEAYMQVDLKCDTGSEDSGERVKNWKSVSRPLEYSNEKVDIFKNIKDIIENYAGKNMLLGGEFNFIPKSSDSIRRQKPRRE